MSRYIIQALTAVVNEAPQQTGPTDNATTKYEIHADHFIVNENVSATPHEDLCATAPATDGADATAQALPQALDSDEARLLLQEAQQRGWLDEHWQPSGIFKGPPRAAILASTLGSLLSLVPIWGPFEQLWHITNLRIRFSNAKETAYYSELSKKARSELRRAQAS